jgi:hypothetical protein
MEPFYMRYFVFHFWSKIMFFVCATTVEQIIFLDHMNRKLVGGKHNVIVYYVNVCAPDPPDVVVWNPFI